MGSLFHLVDFRQGKKTRKLIHNEIFEDCGFEAPRNSLDHPIENLYSNNAVNFTSRHGYGDPNYWSINHLSEAPMKKLISQEISKRPNGSHSSPSVIARLMGVETLPADTKSSRQYMESISENQSINFPKSEELKKSSGSHVSFASNSHRNTKSDYREHIGDDTTSKHKHREHPQEEELQKFKKEFEAYQAARFKEYSKVIELGRLPSKWLAQEELNKEKMAFYANSIRSGDEKRLKENEVHNVPTSQRKKGNRLKKLETFAADLESLGQSSRSRSPDYQQHWSQSSSDNLSEVSRGPSNIVILRPGPESNGYTEESWTSSPGISVDRGSIEDFLEEVKDRLKNEMQGNPYKRSTVRGSGIETPYSERPSDASSAWGTPKDGMMLPRSASTRSYRSAMQFNETGSPEFVPKDTRRLLTERLRNVLKEEKQQDVSARYSNLVHKSRAEKSFDVLRKRNKSRDWDSLKNESDMQSRSFRRDPDDTELSPRNLIRSLSAPVSAHSFGKLLLEDRHMLTGAHIRRKHEVIEKLTMNLKSRKREKSNFREKVSSLKYSLTLRGRLFGKKIQSPEESYRNNGIMKDIRGGPTYMMNYYDKLENSTEVPPSPASICSTPHDQSWRTTDYFYPSPTSESDVHSVDTSMIPQVFREISSNLNELRKQLHELEDEDSKATIADEQHDEVELFEIEDEVEAYIRDLLVASGLYDGSCDTSLSRWDPLGKPISNQVFEEVEESYKQRVKDNDADADANDADADADDDADDDNEVSSKDQVEILNHKVLFDVLNEILPTAVGAPTPMFRLATKATSPVVRSLRGKKLLDHVWEAICSLAYPREDSFSYTIDHMVARDLQSPAWCKFVDEDVYALGKEIECHIIEDLIEETVNKFHQQFFEFA